jgi:AraC-like DNA-binding protein
MEIIKAIVFVQSFVWASLLVRKPSRKNISLFVAFLFLFIIYLLLYVNTVFERQIPLYLVPACTLLLTISVSFFQLRKLHLKHLHKELRPAWFLLAASMLLAGYGFWAGIPVKRFWVYILLFGTATFAYDAYALIRHARKLTFTGSLLEDTASKLSLFLLFDKLLVLLFACLILVNADMHADISTAIRNSFDILVAVLVFITGYMTVTALFRLEGQKHKKYRKNEDKGNNPELVEKVKRLMEDQKPYLDNELSLVKMADMLGISENELTNLLNQEMNTNFYTLVNDYRMETVLKKLKESDKRKYTIMASAYESGFNSKSTFYRIFKEYTQLSPKEYLVEN